MALSLTLERIGMMKQRVSVGYTSAMNMSKLLLYLVYGFLFTSAAIAMPPSNLGAQIMMNGNELINIPSAEFTKPAYKVFNGLKTVQTAIVSRVPMSFRFLAGSGRYRCVLHLPSYPSITRPFSDTFETALTPTIYGRDGNIIPYESDGAMCYFMLDPKRTVVVWLSGESLTSEIGELLYVNLDEGVTVFGDGPNSSTRTETKTVAVAEIVDWPRGEIGLDWQRLAQRRRQSDAPLEPFCHLVTADGRRTGFTTNVPFEGNPTAFVSVECTV